MMTTTQAPPINALDIELGFLTPAQAAAYLTFAFQKQSSPLLLLNRLVARGFLAATMAEGCVRISIESLKDFINNGAYIRDVLVHEKNGEVAKLFNPLFPISGGWYEQPWRMKIPAFVAAVQNEVSRQMPSTLPRKTPGEGPAWAQRNPDIDLMVAPTPELLAIIRAPVPADNPMFPTPDTSAFRNTAEMYLCTELQKFTYQHMQSLSTLSIAANAGSVNLPNVYRNYGIPGAETLFGSIDAYKSIVTAGATAMASNSYTFSLTKFFSQNDPEKYEMLPPAKVSLSLSNSTIMQLAGCDFTRLALLAF